MARNPKRGEENEQSLGLDLEDTKKLWLKRFFKEPAGKGERAFSALSAPFCADYPKMNFKCI